MILIQQTTEANAKRFRTVGGTVDNSFAFRDACGGFTRMYSPSRILQAKSLYIRSVVEWANQFDGDFLA